MTTVQHRKPGTPLTKFFAEGKYGSEVLRVNSVTRNCEPGESARLADRNPNVINTEINIKPITNTAISLKHFDPRSHLRPIHITNRQNNLTHTRNPTIA